MAAVQAFAVLVLIGLGSAAYKYAKSVCKFLQIYVLLKFVCRSSV